MSFNSCYSIMFILLSYFEWEFPIQIDLKKWNWTYTMELNIGPVGTREKSCLSVKYGRSLGMQVNWLSNRRDICVFKWSLIFNRHKNIDFFGTMKCVCLDF